MKDLNARPQAWTRDDGTPMIGMVPIILPPDQVVCPYPLIENPVSVMDHLIVAQRNHWMKPTSLTKQKLLAQELMVTIVREKTAGPASRRLAILLRARKLKTPKVHPVDAAKKKLRARKTEEGRQQGEELLREAAVAAKIHEVRQEGLNKFYRNKLAEALLRRVT